MLSILIILKLCRKHHKLLMIIIENDLPSVEALIVYILKPVTVTN